MDIDKIAYTFDWRKDAKGYSWVFAESCPVDGFNLRTGHSQDFLSMVNSFLTIAWDSQVFDHRFYSIKGYPDEYDPASLNGYSRVLRASKGDNAANFFLSPIAHQNGTSGIAYALPHYLEYTYLEPLNLKGLVDALPPEEHREFWSPVIVKAVKALLGEKVTPPKKTTSTPNKAKAKVSAPKQSAPIAVGTPAKCAPHPKKTMGCTKGELRAQGREQWMGEKIPKGTIVYATDGSSGEKGSSYAYVTSLGDYYVAHDKGIKNNSSKAELNAITMARENAMRHMMKGKRVLILSDNTSAVAQAKSMELPRGISKDLLEIRWVRGHSGHPLNQAADTIASTARKEGYPEKAKKARMDKIMHVQIEKWRKHLEQQSNSNSEKRAAMESYFAVEPSSTLGELWKNTSFTLGSIWSCTVKEQTPTPKGIFA